MTDSGQQVVASAPGKLVLCGEYAVLEGAPAICMAVNRRARVTVALSGDEHHIVTAPGLTHEYGRFQLRDGELEWLEAGEKFRLFDAVWRTAEAQPDAGRSFELDTREFLDSDGGSKLGIGSSAALAVALSAALCELAGSGADTASIAFAAHREFQDGRGSGVDIACSVAGGLIEYRQGDAVRSRRLSWPSGLAHALIWSGVSASTKSKLEHLDNQLSRPSRAALVYSARRIAGAWSAGSADAILDEYRDYIKVLREFSIDHELGIFDAGHAELTAAAHAAGLVYKPCGAGGGDMGIVLGDDPAAIEAFVGNALPPGFQLLDMNIDLNGVQVVREEN